MFHLGCIFEGLDLGDVPVPKAAAGHARMHAAARSWTRDFGLPYREKGGPERKLVFTVTVLGEDGKPWETAEVTLVTDADLFLQIAEVAVDLGAVGMTAALGAILGAKDLIQFTRKLLLSAHDAVERWLAIEFALAEEAATMLARAEARAMQQANELARKQFERRSFMGTTARVLVLPGTGKRDLFAKLVEARGHRLKIEALAVDMAARDAKDGSTPEKRAAARERDKYRALWFELYAGPHRAAMIELGRVQDEIYAIFPPALAILPEVGSDLAGWVPIKDAAPGDKTRMAKVEAKYDDLIWSAILTHRGILDKIDRSLVARSVPGWAKAYFEMATGARIAAGSLTGHLITRLTAEAPGTGDAIIEVGKAGFLPTLGVLPIFGIVDFLAKQDAFLDENHVLARVPLVARMESEAAADSATGLDAEILGTFLRDLDRVERALIAEDKAHNRAWHVVEMGLAVCGLLVGLATLITGAGEVILPASIGLLVTLLGGALLAGTIILLGRAVFAALNQGLRGNAQLRDRLLDLGQKNPEALEELGRFAEARRDLMLTLAKTVVEELIELAAQRLLPAFAFALDLRDHYDAMETLADGVFAPAAAD